MIPPLRVRVSKLMFYESPWRNHHFTSPLLMRICSFSSLEIDGGVRQSVRGGGKGEGVGSTASLANKNSATNNDIVDDNKYSYSDQDTTRMYNTGHRQNPPDPIPNRPLRGEKSPNYRSEQDRFSRPSRNHGLRSDSDGKGYDNSRASVHFSDQRSRSLGLRGGGRTIGGQPSSTSGEGDRFPFDENGGDENNGEHFMKRRYSHNSLRAQQSSSFPSDKQQQQQGNDFLEKFKLGFDKEDKKEANPSPLYGKQPEIKTAGELPSPPPQDADEIFKKMKETGLIPNAVAMLDSLCKDGLVQEAMKLFGLMREKGTIPEVVIYTAVVEGFCKAQKLDDAIRIFRKMQNNDISPNAFSYTVLIQGLCKGKRFEDALGFCLEMLEAGHSPNLATFVVLVDGFCQEKGLEEARSIIATLREKGYLFDEKAVREYLDKKGPSLPLVWEAIVGKNSSHRPF